MTLKKALFTIHSWLGLASGIIITIVCLTGTIYTFRPEVTDLQIRNQVNIEPKGSYSVDGIIRSQKIPEGYYLSSVSLPKSDYLPLSIDYNQIGGRERKSVLLNPYTGQEVTVNTKATDDFFFIMFRLHRWLMLSDIGKMIVAFSVVFFVIICLTGLYLWAPTKWRFKYIKKGLTLNTKRNFRVLLFDLHNVLGFYSLIFLVIMGLTGLFWSFEWYRTGVRKITGTYTVQSKGNGKRAQDGSGNGSNLRDGSGQIKGRNQQSNTKTYSDSNEILVLNFDQIIDTADKTFGEEGCYYRISIPQKASERANLANIPLNGFIENTQHRGRGPSNPNHIQISKYREFGLFTIPYRDMMNIDITTSEVVSTKLYKNLPFGAKVMGVFKALHTGDVFGYFTKIIYAITSLIGSTLPITGIWLFLKRKKFIK